MGMPKGTRLHDRCLSPLTLLYNMGAKGKLEIMCYCM